MSENTCVTCGTDVSEFEDFCSSECWDRWWGFAEEDGE